MKFRGVRPVFVRTISDAYIPIVYVSLSLSPCSPQGRAWYLQFWSVSDHHGGGGVHEGGRGN